MNRLIFENFTSKIKGEVKEIFIPRRSCLLHINIHNENRSDKKWFISEVHVGDMEQRHSRLVLDNRGIFIL